MLELHYVLLVIPSLIRNSLVLELYKALTMSD